MISTETLKQYLNIDGTGKDTFLSACIASAKGEVETFCNRKFTSGDYTDYLEGNCNNLVFLKNFPINEVTSIKYLNGENFLNLDSTCAIYENINAIKILNNILPKRTVKIEYNAGWNADECNEDLKGVILEMASINYFNSPLSGQARLGKSSENMATQAKTSSSFKEPDWKEKVKKYRVRLMK